MSPNTYDTSGYVEACALHIPTEALSSWRDNQLTQQEADRIAYHAPTCRACSERLAFFDAVAQALRQQPTPMPRPSLWSETQQRLVQESWRDQQDAHGMSANLEHPAIRSTVEIDDWGGQPRTTDWNAPTMSQSQHPSGYPNPSRSTQIQHLSRAGRIWRVAGAAVAAVLIVGLLIGVLVSRHGFPSFGGTTTKVKTPAASVTATATTTPTSSSTQWQVVSNKLGYGDAMAPSNPTVVYYAGVGPANGSKGSPIVATVTRSDDEGAHWTKLALPTPNGQTIQPANIYVLEVTVSPLSANTAFLTMQTAQAGLCSSPGFASPLHQGQPAAGNKLDAAVLAGAICQMQFVSTDGGANWQQLSLPALGLLGIAQIQPADNVPQDAFKAQGTRLYSTVVDVELAASGVIPPGRLVASDDGGVTWKLVDGAIAAQGQAIYDYAPAPTGSTVFAVTEPVGAQGGEGPPYTTPNYQLWHSADGGASWVKVGGIPNNWDNGMLVTSSASGQSLLYMASRSSQPSGNPQAANTFQSSMSSALGAALPEVLDVSADGGAHWTQAPMMPTVNVGATGAILPPLGPLPDGSVVMQLGDSSYGAWKLGDNAWHIVAPPPPGDSAAYGFALFSTDSTGRASIWIFAVSALIGNGDITTTPLPLLRAVIS